MLNTLRPTGPTPHSSEQRGPAPAVDSAGAEELCFQGRCHRNLKYDKIDAEGSRVPGRHVKGECVL